MGTEVCVFHTCKGMPKLDAFLFEFETRVLEEKWFLDLDAALKAAIASWWDVHK